MVECFLILRHRICDSAIQMLAQTHAKAHDSRGTSIAKRKKKRKEKEKIEKSVSRIKIFKFAQCRVRNTFLSFFLSLFSSFFFKELYIYIYELLKAYRKAAVAVNLESRENVARKQACRQTTTCHEVLFFSFVVFLSNKTAMNR